MREKGEGEEGGGGGVVMEGPSCQVQTRGKTLHSPPDMVIPHMTCLWSIFSHWTASSYSLQVGPHMAS